MDSQSQIEHKWITSKIQSKISCKRFFLKKKIDYEETFKLIVKWIMIRTMISIAAQKKFKLYHIHVKIAFFHRNLKEEVYIDNLLIIDSCTKNMT